MFDQKCGTCHCFGCKIFATGPRAGRSRFRILAGVEVFLFTPTLRDQPWGPPSLPFNGYLLSLPGIKRPGSEVYNSPPSNTDVTNEWRCASSAPIRLHCVERDGFISTLNLQLPRCQDLKSRILPLVLVFVGGPMHDIFTGSLQYQLAHDVPTVSSFSHP